MQWFSSNLAPRSLDWDESKHPRGEGGKFSSGGGDSARATVKGHQSAALRHREAAHRMRQIAEGGPGFEPGSPTAKAALGYSAEAVAASRTTGADQTYANKAEEAAKRGDFAEAARMHDQQRIQHDIEGQQAKPIKVPKYAPPATMTDLNGKTWRRVGSGKWITKDTGYRWTRGSESFRRMAYATYTRAGNYRHVAHDQMTRSGREKKF